MSLTIRVLLAAPLLVAVAACAPSTTVNSPAPDASTSYIVRLGADTVAAEQFTKAGYRIESRLLQRYPNTFIAISNIEMGSNGLPVSWRYETRLPNGSRPLNGATATLTFGTDSTTYSVMRDTGTGTSRRIAGGGAIPILGNSALTQNLAVAWARMQGKDSVQVPTVSTTGTRGSIPMRFVTADSVRIWFGGDPVYIKLDGDGQVRWVDGSASTNKTLAVRVPRVDLTTLANRFVATQTVASAPRSPRDTARSQIMGNVMWIDYSRPSLRGRNPWVNGVLGDTLWRTGADRATHFRTDADLRINGQLIPAGTYTLWTHVFPGNSRYELIINRQTGQWGAPVSTSYNQSQDVARVPLTVRSVATSAEQFTMMIEPSGDGGVIAMQWGRTRLETPFTVIRR